MINVAQSKNIEVSVVLPTYNESANIGHLIERLNSALSQYSNEIIVVDDDSPDKTWEIAAQYEDKNVRVIRRINERKLVTAIFRGIHEAKGKYVVWMDADLSMPPETIPSMLALLKDADIVVGSRYAREGKDNRPLIRVISSRFINFVTNLILNFDIKDYDSGFIAAKKEIVTHFDLKDASYGDYCIELLYKAGKKGHKIKEIGYVFTDRRAGESKTADTFFSLAKYGYLYLKKIISLRLKQ